MNWRRGLLRLWLILSTVWVVLICAAAYAVIISPYLTASAENVCFEAAKNRNDGTNPFDCFHSTGMKFDDLIPLWSQLLPYLVAALAPALILLLLGLAGFWITSGFQARR